VQKQKQLLTAKKQKALQLTIRKKHPAQHPALA